MFAEPQSIRTKRLRSNSFSSSTGSISDSASVITSNSNSVSPGLYNNDSVSKQICYCGVCGKKYKHRSCLYKHLWEHHEAWNACLKYNLTKHQQVKMMEAAQTLVNLMYIKL